MPARHMLLLNGGGSSIESALVNEAHAQIALATLALLDT